MLIMALLVRTEAKDIPQLTNRNLIQIYELMRVKVRYNIKILFTQLFYFEF